nr:EF-hand domain-containing protein [Sphingomonas sp. Y57]
MRQAFLLALLLASPAVARRDGPPPVCPEPVRPVLFISPMGEPFRPKGEGDDPVRRWFDQADRNGDGLLTVGELMVDGDRFFATLDKDKSGELLPDEVSAYEQDVAPEIRLYQRRPERPADGGAKDDERDRPRPAKRRGRPVAAGYDGAIGAGRYAFLNIPNPVAAADSDLNRAITAQEFRAAAAGRFADLDPQQTKALGFAQLPRTPAQVAANAACLERIKEKAKEKRR